MMNKFNYFFFFPLMILSILMAISSNSWFNIWFTMEINLMSFLPMIIINNKKSLIFMKYFLIQSMSSSIMLFSSLPLISSLMYLNTLIITFFYLNMNMAILTKLGFPPFFMWYPNLMNKLSWNNCFLLSTFQKIIPFFMLSNLKLFMSLNIIMSILVSLFSSINNLNFMSIRLMMSFSSLNHMSWLLISLMLSNYLWNMYFLNYFFLTMTLMHFFKKININYLNEMMLYKFNNKYIPLIMILLLLSMGGMPPLMGFMMKWFSLNIFMSMNMNFLIMTIMIFTSVISMFFYLRLMLSTSILTKMEFKMKNKKVTSLTSMYLMLMLIFSFNAFMLLI
uniref:NADH-ubiquinone oxidoreductase chain 2 n=1 Tax=Exallonyx sp. ZJUH_2016014 TaxID=2491158 RepID=A0A3Q8UA22_9HYME|nr:NADH dehydrogenase subunit 2 [Exallonyx sp. ZJUH_2016014]